MTTADFRRQKYGEAMDWLNSGHDIPELEALLENPDEVEKLRSELYKTKVATEYPHAWALMQELQHEHADASDPLVKTGWLDCIFPFDSQSNVCAIRMGEKVPPAWLPPGTQIAIKFKKRWPVEQALERLDVTDSVFYNNTNPKVDPVSFDRKPVKIEFKKMVISYESVVLRDDSVIKSLHNRGAVYWQDGVSTHVRSLLSEVNYDELRFPLENGVKQVIATFAPELQLFPDPTKRQFYSSRRSFPTNLLSIEISLIGRDGIIFDTGLMHVNDSERNSSTSVKAVVEKYQQEGLFDRTFDDFAPKSSVDTFSHNAALLVDVAKYNTKEPQEILLRLRYIAPFSPKNWLGILFAITQKKITWSKTKNWEIEDVV